MTTEEQDLLAHALGAASVNSPMGWRNHFMAMPGDHDDCIWQGMVTKGWARLVRPAGEVFPGNVYQATDTGIVKLKEALSV